MFLSEAVGSVATDIAQNAGETVDKVANGGIDWAALKSTVLTWVMSTGIKVIIALLVLFISFKIINWVGRKLEKKNAKNGKLDKTIFKTVVKAVKIALKVIIAACLVAYLGIDTSGITALIASLGVCVGLAVDGVLSNIAGGLLILITRPFKVDDFVEMGDVIGTVEDIHVCHTVVCTLDNRVIYVPNSVASGSTVINYSVKEFRRVDLEFEISEEEDFEDAKKILENIVANHEKVLKDRPSTIRVCGATDDGVVICCRAWCKNADYWDVFFDIREQAKKGFDAAGIEFPYEQIDVRVIDKRDREAR
ncbi:MAG: mechanosensitive ion channel family protein [Clostridia bacterium]|nr:mechanosensitive ion channel family protein [Clostridia bacterium]